ncbi:MAG: conserved repeat protein [Proteobacteria bacterium]|nr:conserved repeat protein [Pseudomonadota bacterium]
MSCATFCRPFQCRFEANVRQLRFFRFVFNSSTRVRRRLRPAGQVLLWLCFVAGALGVNTQENLAHTIFTLTLSLLLIDFIAAWLLHRLGQKHPARLSLERHLSEFVTTGQVAQYQLKIRNTGRKTLHGAQLIESLHQPYPDPKAFRERHRYRQSVARNFFDRRVGYPDFVDWLRRLRGLDLEPIALPSLNPGQSAELSVPVLPVQRTMAGFDTPKLALASPLGLFWVFYPVTVAGDASLCILPKAQEIEIPSQPSQRHLQPGGISLAMRVGDSEEFRSLRDYRPGDPLRAIHWRSWAKSGKPVVREYHDEYFARHALVLDTAVPSPFSPALETAVSLAAAMVARPRDADSLLDMMFVGTRVHRLTAGRGLGHTDALLRVLATIAPSPPESVGELLATLQQNARQLSSVIAIFVGWDRLRQEAVSRLFALGLQPSVLVVASPSDDERQEAEKRFFGCVRWIAPEQEGASR